MSFKKGDKVKIKPINDLYCNDPHFRNRTPNFVTGMDEFAGRYAKVMRYISYDRIILDIDGGRYNWHTDWLMRKPPLSLSDNLFEL